MGYLNRLKQSVARAAVKTTLFNILAVKENNNRYNRKLPPIDLHSVQSFMNNTNSMPFEELSPGLSQPVWGPEISTVGAYSREGYTSKTFDTPAIPFVVQTLALQQDEDVQLSVNKLAAQVTGGEHYIKGVNDSVTEYLSQFSKNINFDTFDTLLIRELLWYGNSVWKPRMGIANVKSFDDLMHIPISSFKRVWWDRQRQPYKYEFRGAEYQGYHNPGEVLVFTWNNVNASVFGTGFGTSVTSPRIFEMSLNGDKTETLQLPSMLDRKYAIEFLMQMASQRYVTRNVYIAQGASEEERAQLESQVEQLTIGQDLVAGTGLEVQELGTNTRTFDPTEFTETTTAQIMKALNDFSGKQGSEKNATFANAEQSQESGEIGLSAFNIHVKTQLENKLFKPWYEANPIWSNDYLGGLMFMLWDDIKFELNFGAVEKKDIPIEAHIKLLELLMGSGIPLSPKSLIKQFEQAGLTINEDDIVQIENMYNPTMQQPDDSSQQLPQNNIDEAYPQFNNQVMGNTPMENPIYDDMATYPRGSPFVFSNFNQSNTSQDWNYGRNYE